MAFEKLYEDCNLSDELLSEGEIRTEEVRSWVGLTQMSKSPLTLKKSDKLDSDLVKNRLGNKIFVTSSPSKGSEGTPKKIKEISDIHVSTLLDHSDSPSDHTLTNKDGSASNKHASWVRGSLKQEISGILKFLVEVKAVEQKTLDKSRISKSNSTYHKPYEFDELDFVTMKQIDAIYNP